MAIEHETGDFSLVSKHFNGDKFESIGKLASHVGSGISIWLVAVVINKDLNKNSNKLASVPL